MVANLALTDDTTKNNQKKATLTMKSITSQKVLGI